MEDEVVAQFTSITGASPERALQYLRLTDGNLEQAMQLFFDSDGIDLEGSAPPATGPPATTPQVAQAPPQYGDHASGYTDSSGVVHIDSDEDITDDNDPEVTGYNPRAEATSTRSRSALQTPATVTPPTGTSARGMDNDEALARRLQEEFYAGGDMAGVRDADGIRAPIGRTTETLVGPGADYLSDPDEMRAAVLEQMRARQRSRPQGRPGIFNQQAGSTSIWNDADGESDLRRQRLARATGGASEQSSKANLLAEMYRPPFELMSRLSWDEARDEGKAEEKWILVNIQDPAVFDCQILNRDIWKNESIRDTVKENFLFMQYSKDDPRGSQYIQYYFQARDSQDAYPHIAIVDPRTGEQVKVWSGPPVPKAPDFLMQLHEFLDRYSLKVNARNPVAKRKPEVKKEKQVDRMTEDEMLEMALQNSLANNGGQREDDPDDLTRSVGEIGKGKGKATAEDDDVMEEINQTGTNGHTTSTENHTSPFSLISGTNPHTEPAPDPSTTTRIQFRHSGGRIIRRFALGDPVRRLYEWLKASPLEGKEGVAFELVFMQRNLIELLDDTIEHAGLKNGTVMVEFLEE